MQALVRQERVEIAGIMDAKRAAFRQAGERRAVAPASPGHWAPIRQGQRSVTVVDVEAVRELTQTFRTLDNKFGGGHTHAVVAQYLDSTVASLLHEGSYTETIGQELFAGAAQLAHLGAWTAYDIQEHERTQVYFTKALELASVAGDHGFSGEILAARSHHAIHLGHPIEAVGLARASQHAATKAAIPALLAEAHELEANGHALLGDHKASLSSLRESERAFQRSDPASVPDWLRYFDEDYLAVRFAHCFRDLKDWGRAQEYALRVVSMSDGRARTNVFNRALLATAYIETDVDEACRVALDAVHLAKGLQSTRVVHYVRDFRRRLNERHGKDPIAQRFTEETIELLGAN